MKQTLKAPPPNRSRVRCFRAESINYIDALRLFEQFRSRDESYMVTFMDVDDKPLVVFGSVRWFDLSKGYGFLAADAYGDILLHANVLRGFGQSAVSEGTVMVVEIKRSARGYQVVEIVRIESPAEGLQWPTIVPTFHDVSIYSHLEILPARVKWYETKKGFGFVNVFGDPRDAFLHSEVVRASGLGNVAQGEAIAVRISEKERGLMVVHALNWGAQQG